MPVSAVFVARVTEVLDSRGVCVVDLQNGAPASAVLSAVYSLRRQQYDKPVHLPHPTSLVDAVQRCCVKNLYSSRTKLVVGYLPDPLPKATADLLNVLVGERAPATLPKTSRLLLFVRFEGQRKPKYCRTLGALAKQGRVLTAPPTQGEPLAPAGQKKDSFLGEDADPWEVLRTTPDLAFSQFPELLFTGACAEAVQHAAVHTAASRNKSDCALMDDLSLCSDLFGDADVVTRGLGRRPLLEASLSTLAQGSLAQSFRTGRKPRTNWVQNRARQGLVSTNDRNFRVLPGHSRSAKLDWLCCGGPELLLASSNLAISKTDLKKFLRTREDENQLKRVTEEQIRVFFRFGQKQQFGQMRAT